LENGTLARALEDFLVKQPDGAAIHTTFTLQGEPREIPPEWEANILRIAQEALTNALRHARASTFQVTLTFGDDEVRLDMRDNGGGFDTTGNHPGFGLRGMTERTNEMGGRLSIQSAFGIGTAIHLVLPLIPFDEAGNS
jgi:signal transduction histidine kinase